MMNYLFENQNIQEQYKHIEKYIVENKSLHEHFEINFAGIKNQKIDVVFFHLRMRTIS